MAFAITEPDAGSNCHKIATTATRDGDIYRLKGTKYYISGADESEAVLVVTRTGVDEDTGRGRLSLFVVDLDSPGLDKTLIPVEIVAPEKQFTLFFDNVEVPADRLLGTEGDGLRQVFVGLNPERIMTAAMANGIGRYALDKAAAYARDRVGVGHAHRAATRASPTRWPRPRSRSSWPGSCARKAAWACDYAAPTPAWPARRPTWPSTRRPRPRSARSTRPSRPTGATGCRRSTAWPTCGAWPGSCAPPR